MKYLLLVSLLPFILLSTNINNDLLPMKSHKHQQILQYPINVTLGESFRIILPSLDIKKKPSDYSVYQISQETFLNFETSEKHGKPKDTKDQKRKKVSEKTFSCKLKQSKMSIKKTVSRVNEPNPSGYFNPYNNKKYVFVFSNNLIYSLDPTNLEVSAFSFNEKNMKLLSSIRLPSSKTSAQTKAAIACSSDQTKVYVFTDAGMWTIQVKTILTQVTLMKQLNGFNSMEEKIDDIKHGAYGYVVGISKIRAVYIIPESPESQDSYIKINSYNGTMLAPQDVFIDQRYIYILDRQHGIYIYKLFGTGEVKEHDWIELNTYGNTKILGKEKTIFVNYNDENGDKIIQINYDFQNKKAELVRYFKDDIFVTYMQTSLVLVNSPEMNSQNSKEPFLILAADNGQIEMYPFNIDPRTIHSLNNGVKMYVDGIRQIHSLYQNYYLLVTNTGIQFVQIDVNKPQLVCELKKSTGHSYYQVQFTTNISSCEHYDHQIQHKKFYNNHCQLRSTYTIFVDDPERSQFQKVILYGVVLFSIIIFVVGILCLIEWRNNKLSLLGRLKDQIIRFRDRHRKMQPFVEQEQGEKNEIQFELPKSQPIDDIVQ